MIDELEKLSRKLVTDLIENNASTITQELRENPEGKLSVGMSLKFRLVANRLYAAASLTYSRKFEDGAEDSTEIEDPTQPGLPGVDKATLTIQTGEKEVMVPYSTFKRVCDNVKKGAE